MKRFLALFLICCCVTSCAFAAESADYTVAAKLLKQLAAGSGFSGILTLEADTEAFSTQKPIVLDMDYLAQEGMPLAVQHPEVTKEP